MKKILITNAFGPQNRGDHELLQRLLQLIESSSSSRVDISILTTHPKESAAAFPLYRSIKSPFGRPTSKISLGIMIWDLIFWFLSSYIPYFSCFLSKDRGEKFQLFIDADAIILCPGGYLYSNSLSLYVNLLNILPTKDFKVLQSGIPNEYWPF
ncbi:hypothetical protein [Aliivibrio wodanis]|uniref:hypothetical protein n=1 Tax=Aliivibrio wodanis TaxID=80852 RepID=UPI00406BF564